MASPQAENGHVDIANEIMEAIAKVHLSPYESQIIHALWRKTYGWHKKADRISFSQWEALTGIARRHIARTLKHLIARQIITRTGSGYHIEYAFQKDYSLWQALPPQVTVPSITSTGNTPLPLQGTEALPLQVPTKETKETIQKKYTGVVKGGFIYPEEWNEMAKEGADILLKMPAFEALAQKDGAWFRYGFERFMERARYRGFEDTLGELWHFSEWWGAEGRQLKKPWAALTKWMFKVKK